MSIYILDRDVHNEVVATKNKVLGEKVLFHFIDRELPDAIPFPYETKLNEIEYPGGHRTNQIIGVFRKELEWSGLFYGTYYDQDDNPIAAMQKVDQLTALLGKPVVLQFPIEGGYAGFTGEYIIKEFIPTVHNYLKIEYKIVFAPHERQEKVKPKSTVSFKQKPDAKAISTHVTSLHKQGKKQTKVSSKAAGATTKNVAVAQQVIPNFMDTVPEITDNPF